MARTEARIFTSIWRDEDFVALAPSAQRLYMFLLSQDDVAYCGVLPLRERRWASKASGLTVAEIERDLKALEGTAYPSPNPDPASAKTPFLVIDRDTGEVLIRALIRRDGVWKQPNLLKQARDTADQVESPQIRAALAAELRRLPLEETTSDLVKRVIGEFIADLEKGNPYPSTYPSGDPPDNPSDEVSGDPSADPAQGIGGCNGSSSLVPQSPVPRAPDPTSLPSQQRDRKQGTRLPDDFAVTPDMVAWFRDHCPHVDGKRETEKFLDYWRGKPGKDGRKLDWIATWRNWMRTAEERSVPRTRSSPSEPASTTDQRIAQGQALKARIAATRPQEQE